MELDRMIDHIILKPEAAKAAVQKIVDGAKEYNFLSVCINPYWVTLANEQLADTSIAVYTAIGFPLGANTPEVKAHEAADVIRNGANEVDMMISIGTLRLQQYGHVRQDIQGAIDAVKGEVLVKVIIETVLLTDEGKVRACELTGEAGADFVKISTGFSTGGARAADIRLMRETTGPDMDVRASGGMHNAEEALAMIEAETTHTGVSTGIAIASGATGEGY